MFQKLRDLPLSRFALMMQEKGEHRNIQTAEYYCPKHGTFTCSTYEHDDGTRSEPHYAMLCRSRELPAAIPGVVHWSVRPVVSFGGTHIPGWGPDKRPIVRFASRFSGRTGS